MKLICLILLLPFATGCQIGMHWKDGKFGISAGLDGTEIIRSTERLWNDTSRSIEDRWKGLKDLEYEETFRNEAVN